MYICTYFYNVQEYRCCPYNLVIQRIAHTCTMLNMVGDSCPREATYYHSGTAVLPEQCQHVPKALFSRETGTINTRIFCPAPSILGCKGFSRVQRAGRYGVLSTENRVQMTQNGNKCVLVHFISLYLALSLAISQRASFVPYLCTTKR